MKQRERDFKLDSRSDWVLTLVKVVDKRTTAAVLGALAMGAALLASDAAACGDKFLVIGRGAKRVAKARHPAAIALYLHTGSPLAAVAKEMRLEKTLRDAGHKVEVVPDETTLQAALASRRLNFVIADWADAQGLTLPDAHSPRIVPVVRANEMTPVSFGYPLVIRAGKSLSYLSALDAAMGQQSGGSSR